MDDDTFRALIEQAHQLDQLTKHPGWPVLLDGLNHQMHGDKVAILNNAVADFDQYRKLAGRLVGIHYALDFPNAVNKMVDAERERRAQFTEPDDAA